MYFNIPVIDTVIPHRGDPAPFCKIVERQIELFNALEKKEEDLCGNASEYAHQYQVTAHYLDGPVMQRRGLRIVMDTFKEQNQKLAQFEPSLPEASMDSVMHKEYLQTVALIEVLGNIILNPYKLRIIARYCPDCEPYFFEPDPTTASLWALRVIRRINIAAYDKSPRYIFGQYDPVTRDFI